MERKTNLKALIDKLDEDESLTDKERREIYAEEESRNREIDEQEGIYQGW